MNSPLKSKNNDNYNIQVVNEVSENKETSIIKKKPDNSGNIIPIKFPLSFKEIINDNNKQDNNEINVEKKKSISVKMIDIQYNKEQKKDNNNIEFKNLLERENENNDNKNSILTFNLIHPEIINNENKNNLNDNDNCQNDNNNEVNINENNEFSFGNHNFNLIPEIEESEKISNKNNNKSLNLSQDNSLLNLSSLNYNLPKQLKSIYNQKNITKIKYYPKSKNYKSNKENLSLRNSIEVSMNVNKIKNIKRGISTDTYNYYSNNKYLRNTLNRGISPQNFNCKLMKTKGKESLNSTFLKSNSVKFSKINNKEIKATYCPRIHPERIMKKWGEIHNTNWYNLSPNSRLKANEEMNQMIKDGIIK